MIPWPLLDKSRLEFEYDPKGALQPIIVDGSAELLQGSDCMVSFQLDGKPYRFAVIESEENEPMLWVEENKAYAIDACRN